MRLVAIVSDIAYHVSAVVLGFVKKYTEEIYACALPKVFKEQFTQ